MANKRGKIRVVGQFVPSRHFHPSMPDVKSIRNELVVKYSMPISELPLAPALSDLLTAPLEQCTKRRLPDPAASLAASLLLATWTVAITEAHRAYARDQNAEKATQAFLRLVDQGTKGVRAALEGTPYV